MVRIASAQPPSLGLVRLGISCPVPLGNKTYALYKEDAYRQDFTLNWLGNFGKENKSWIVILDWPRAHLWGRSPPPELVFILLTGDCTYIKSVQSV